MIHDSERERLLRSILAEPNEVCATHIEEARRRGRFRNIRRGEELDELGRAFYESPVPSGALRTGPARDLLELMWWQSVVAPMLGSLR